MSAQVHATPDPLVDEIRTILSHHPEACPETKLLMEMAIEAQRGEPVLVALAKHSLTDEKA
jgi:hypothetical protein